MTRFYIGALLLLSCAVAAAQNIPMPSAASILRTSSVKTPQRRLISNPFKAHSKHAAIKTSVVHLAVVPQTIIEKERVLKAFRKYGRRIGQINGETLFELKHDYLFVRTTAQDVLPRVSRDLRSRLPSLPPAIPSKTAVTNAPLTSSTSPAGYAGQSEKAIKGTRP